MHKVIENIILDSNNQLIERHYLQSHHEVDLPLLSSDLVICILCVEAARGQVHHLPHH